MSFFLLFPSVSVTPTGVLTFRQFRPSGRFSPVNVPWNRVRVDFNPAPVVAPAGRIPGFAFGTAQPDAPAQSDPGWVIGDPFELDPLDTDIAHPQTRSVSVPTQGDGWYRVVFLDVGGIEDVPSPPVRFPIDVITWRPTPDDIAQVCPAYTRHDIDLNDGEEATGAQHGVFDDFTSPSIADVDDTIDNIMREIVGRAGISALDLNRYAEAARQTAVWGASSQIEAEKASEQAMDADGPAKWKQSSYVACLNDLKTMIPSALRLV